MANREVPESYGICDDGRKPEERPEEARYLADQPRHAKHCPDESEIRRRQNSHTFGVSLRLAGTSPFRQL
jgi:hypothetical protein